MKNDNNRTSEPVLFKLKGFAILEVVEELQSLQDAYGQHGFHYGLTWLVVSLV